MNIKENIEIKNHELGLLHNYELECCKTWNCEIAKLWNYKVLKKPKLQLTKLKLRVQRISKKYNRIKLNLGFKKTETNLYI